MVKKICRAVASCIALILALTFAALPGTSAMQEQPERSKIRQAVSRRNRAARQRVKTQSKPVRRRQTVSYVCPMHLDIHSNSPGTCPKCLMDLVVEKRDTNGARR